MSNQKIGIIGAGNMGEAIMKGLLTGPYAYKPKDIIISDVSKERLWFLKKEYNVKTVSYNEEAVESSDIIILAVKPQNMAPVIFETRKFINPDKLVISIAAGIKTSFIEKHLLGKVPVIRVMPNMPALVQKGISAFCAGKHIKSAHKKTVMQILSNIGSVVEVREGQMDAVCAVSGSGPAYFLFLTEKLIDAGIKNGLSETIAVKLAIETAAGAAAIMSTVKEAPGILRSRVTSKGGTTEAAFKVFEKEGLGKIFEKGVKAAIKRSRELSCL